MSGPDAATAWRRDAAGVVVRLRLTPKADRDAIDGGTTDTAEGPALKARVRAVPEDGEANAALCDLVGRVLGVAKRDVSLVSGHKSRVKSVRVSGDPAALSAAVEMLATGRGTGTRAVKP